MWEDDPIQSQSRCSPIPGRDLESAGVTQFIELNSHDQRLFEHYRQVITAKIREDDDFPDDFEFVPSSVAQQVESPHNCYFRIDLPHAIVTVKIVPNPHVHDLSKHVTLHREPFVGREPSITELTL